MYYVYKEIILKKNIIYENIITKILELKQALGE